MTIKTPALRSKKLTDAAKGQTCALQIVGVCNMNPETVVFAHFPSETHGMAYKSDDFWGADACHRGADACHHCHDVIDGRARYDFEPGEKEEYMLNGLHRTLSRRIRAELIDVKGGKYV